VIRANGMGAKAMILEIAGLVAGALVVVGVEVGLYRTWREADYGGRGWLAAILFWVILLGAAAAGAALLLDWF
jgi:hypothetical protein